MSVVGPSNFRGGWVYSVGNELGQPGIWKGKEIGSYFSSKDLYSNLTTSISRCPVRPRWSAFFPPWVRYEGIRAIRGMDPTYDVYGYIVREDGTVVSLVMEAPWGWPIKSSDRTFIYQTAVRLQSLDVSRIIFWLQQERFVLSNLLHCISSRRTTRSASTRRLNSSTGGILTNYSGNLKNGAHSEMFTYPYPGLRRRSLIRNLLFYLEVPKDRLVECLSTYLTIFGLCSSGHGQIILKTIPRKTYWSQDSSE